MKLFIVLTCSIAFVAASPVSNAVVGWTKVDLDAEPCRKYECNVGNLAAQAAFYGFVLEKPEPRTPVGLIVLVPGQKLRQSVEMGTNITDDLLQDIFPSNDELVLKELKGSSVVQALEHSVHKYTQKDGSSEFLQIANAHIEFDLAQDAGKRLKSARILGSTSGLFEDIKDASTYSVLMPSFLATGNSGFDMLKSEQEILKLSKREVEVARQYIERNSPIIQGLEGRIVVHNFDRAPTGHGLMAQGSLLGVLVAAVFHVVRNF